MSVEYTIDAVQKVVIVKFTGEMKDADLIGIASEAKSHKLFDPNFSEIVDFSAVTGKSVSGLPCRLIRRSFREGGDVNSHNLSQKRAPFYVA